MIFSARRRTEALGASVRRLDPSRLRLTLDVGAILGFRDHHRHLAKLQVFNHLAANPAEPADDVVTFDLVDFLLHALPPSGKTELSADHLLPDGAHRLGCGADTILWRGQQRRVAVDGSAGLAPDETAH